MPAPSLFVESVTRLVGELGAGSGGCVVAVSGGADSVALLRALAGILPRTTLRAAHFNHRLRGAESDADADFVSRLAAGLGIECSIEEWNRGESAPSGTSEEAARLARYAFLRRAAERCGARFVATGHTASDHAETILHHLLRGTGLRGLRGIPLRRPLASETSIELIRPLLHVERAAVEEWLVEIGQTWRTDRSNDTGEFTRNRLRGELLPYLRREFQPRIDDLLGRLGEQADEILTFLRAEALALLSLATLDRQPGAVRLDAAILERGAPVVLREGLVEVWTSQDWPRQNMSQTHWNRAAEVVAGTIPAADMPDGVRIERRENLVLIRGTPRGRES